MVPAPPPPSSSPRPPAPDLAPAFGSTSRPGNDAERDALYHEFQPLVRRLLRQYGDDAEFRSDLEGEIYCRFCQLIEAYEPERGVPLKAYLVRTLSASVYSYARTQWRREHRERRLDLVVSENDRSHCVDPTDEWNEQLRMEELLRGLPAAIARLPTRQRQVVIWRYYEGRSFDEIAATLHVRPATARSLLRHGLNHLRRQLVPDIACPALF
jgi:RNA polymerase sigma-70 factor (ECF subfamily)